MDDGDIAKVENIDQTDGLWGEDELILEHRMFEELPERYAGNV